MEVDEGWGGAVGGDAWAGDDEGDAHGVLVEVLFAEEPVAADGEAGVGGEDDEGGVALVFGDGVEDAADLVVHEGDGGVVVGEVALDVGGGARVRGEEFVADFEFAVIERVFGEEVVRDRDGGWLEFRVPFGWGFAWVVRGVEGDVAEPWGGGVG